LKTLIAGAGIGGLTAALCLLKAGHDVRIFERATAFNEAGAGIQCGANALQVFDYLGLLTSIKALAVAPEGAEFRDHKSGKVIYQMPFGKYYEQQYGTPYLHIHRADLHQILLDEIQRLSPQSIELNAELMSFSESSDKVRITLADQRSFTGDCLIGCDGIKSRIRKQLHGDSQAVYTGNVAWRGIVPADQLPNDFMDKVVSNFVGPRKHMVIYYLRDQQLLNFVGVTETANLDTTENTSWVTKSPWQELANDFTGWHPTVQTLIDAVDKNECYRWALFDHVPLKNWSSQRVTLLGDAAHATLPFMASGAAMAIEDARILQRALDQADNISEGLSLYQRNRYSRTAKIQRMSRQAGKLYHIPSKALLRTAFKALSLRPQRAEAFLPEYDANTIELV